MADVTNIPQVFDTQNPARLASQLRTFAAQVQQVARKVSFEGAIWVWDDGCRTVPINTTESGATEFVFKSAFPGDGTVIITVVGAEGGVTASLNGDNLGTMSNVDTSSEISYEFYVDNLRDTDNPLNSLKVWSTTGDSAEVRRVEIWRNHLKTAIDSVTTLAETTATNFNARNDRDGSAITAPVVAGDGTAIDHVLNTDSTSTISFEWTWGGDESDIDGFRIVVRESSSATSYNIGDAPAEETEYFASADKRAFFLQGVATDKYYTFGVSAYRRVDPDVDADEIIYSTVAQPALSAEDPYRPNANVAFDGDITGTIDGTAATAVSSAITNFNSRNDRDDTAIVNPVIASDGTAVDHAANDDGSVDISIEFSWSGDEPDIDGFIFYYRSSSSASSYNFGDSPATESKSILPADKRVAFMLGVAANRYYTFGVQAYRVVDPDIDASGLITSDIVQCTRTEEDPYRPSATVAFNGDVTGTIDGLAAGDVNQWAAIEGAGKAENNATRNDNPANLIRNGGAEYGVLTPHTVDASGSGTWGVGTGAPYSGKYHFFFTPPGGGLASQALLRLNGEGSPISCEEGDRFRVTAQHRASSAGTVVNRNQLQIYWVDGDGAVISIESSSLDTPTLAYAEISVEGTAPAGTAGFYPRSRVFPDGGDKSSLFDNLKCNMFGAFDVKNTVSAIGGRLATFLSFDPDNGVDLNAIVPDSLNIPIGGTETTTQSLGSEGTYTFTSIHTPKTLYGQKVVIFSASVEVRHDSGTNQETLYLEERVNGSFNRQIASATVNADTGVWTEYQIFADGEIYSGPDLSDGDNVEYVIRVLNAPAVSASYRNASVNAVALFQK